ncbi:MAG: serine/threonine protein kinase, partial [Anaerolineaceae bacterium]|nr:serine/threonine protein kinase [Anaerolineaceae bacterium]
MQDGIVGQSLGRYHVVAPLGEGGMASVYQAYDLNLERNVAIKIIRVDMNQDSGFLRRFEREARALAKLDHPYILKVLDYGEERGLPYLVMPFMDGGTLKEVKKPMPYREAARLLLPIAQALAYAHKEGIIHRDLKPANILISKSGEPILSDFGIAKMLDTGESTQLTGTGMSIGTPDYMAPEQWMGTSNAQTDVYALGVVFYELLTGRRPFIADTPAAVFLKHREDPLPDPRRFVPEIPTGAMQILYNALAKKPQDRFHDMASFAMALDQLIHAQDGAVTVLSAPDAVDTMIAVEPPAAKKLPRGKLILIAASALVVIGLLCGGMIWLGVKNDWFGGTAADPTE